MSVSRWQRDTLAGRTLGRIMGASLVLLCLFNVLIGLATHHQLHQQTDALLVQLVESEAHLSLAETRQPLHVHATIVSLPSPGARPLVKHGLVFDARCRVRAATPMLQHVKTLPEALCHNPARVFFAPGLLPEELRVATTRVTWRDGSALTFMVGIDHAPIDGAAWRLIAVAVLLSLLGLLALGLLLGRITATISRDLSTLNDACDALELGQIANLDRAQPTPFRLDADAPRELRALSQTLTSLLDRTRATLDTQTRFVAEAAHELRTPITALRGELEVTLRRERDAAEYRETLEYLCEDVDRLERLGESLLLAARTGEDDLTVAPTPLRPLLQQTLDQLHEAIIRADLRVALDLPEDAHATLDELATSRVITNLITNTLAHAQATQLTIALAPDARTGRLIVHVTDDGAGVPVALRPHLFTPFQRGDRNRGHGLGLFIARRLMRQQGGDLTLGTAPDGRGTRWTLSFLA